MSCGDSSIGVDPYQDDDNRIKYAWINLIFSLQIAKRIIGWNICLLLEKKSKLIWKIHAYA